MQTILYNYLPKDIVDYEINDFCLPSKDIAKKNYKKVLNQIRTKSKLIEGFRNNTWKDLFISIYCDWNSSTKRIIKNIRGSNKTIIIYDKIYSQENKIYNPYNYKKIEKDNKQTIIQVNIQFSVHVLDIKNKATATFQMSVDQPITDTFITNILKNDQQFLKTSGITISLIFRGLLITIPYTDMKIISMKII